MSEMFSRRTGWDRRPNALARAAAERRHRGRPVLDLTVSNPTGAGLAWDEARLRALLDRPGVATHRADALGLEPARAAVAAWWRERGVPARADRLVLTASTSEAYGFLFRLLAEPGDAIALPRPGYPLLDFLAGMDELELRRFPWRLDGDRWRLDLDALADTLTERTRAVVIVSPNNPTGSRVEEAEARALGRLCAERGLALISDEVFGEFDWPGSKAAGARSLLQPAAEEGALVFALSGLSKAAGLPQLKLAWIAVEGPAEQRQEALERLEWIADSYLSVSTPVQLAAGELLAESAAFRENCSSRLGAALAVLEEDWVRAGGRRLPGGAGWSAVLELPVPAAEEELAAALLVEDGLVVHPGRFFDLRPEGHVVVSLLTRPEDLRRGLLALRRRVRLPR